MSSVYSRNFLGGLPLPPKNLQSAARLCGVHLVCIFQCTVALRDCRLTSRHWDTADHSARRLRHHLQTVNKQKQHSARCHWASVATISMLKMWSDLFKKVARTRLPSVGFRSWSRFLAVSLHVTWVINQAVGCRYFPPGPQLPEQPLRGLLPVSLLGEETHDGCEQFA